MRNKLFLFDIDGTLISPGNVARKLLDKIIVRNFDQSPNLTYDDVAGSTDPLIVERALAKIGIADGEISKGAKIIFDQYQKELAPVYNNSDLPFVYDDCVHLLNRVKQAGLSYGLLSGNIKATAKIKLDKFNLWDVFPFGVFGDDAAMRSDLPWLAREKAWDALEKSFRFEDIIIVGDTAEDAIAANKNQTKSIVVCRKHERRNELENSNPTILVDDLNEVDVNSII